LSLSVFSCTVLFVSSSQVIGCEDRLRNDLYCVEWGVKLYSIHPCYQVNKVGQNLLQNAMSVELTCMYQFNDSFPSRTVVSTVRPFNLASLKVSIFTCKGILVAPFVLVNPHYSSNVLSNLK